MYLYVNNDPINYIDPFGEDKYLIESDCDDPIEGYEISVKDTIRYCFTVDIVHSYWDHCRQEYKYEKIGEYTDCVVIAIYKNIGGYGGYYDFCTITSITKVDP